ncbi:nuclear transport factor 2 family protein [Thalassotalea litorea]|uniref:Nuclear transport factor 2 family protein n=2 Tax=Thalassotalea litorea TaxID=2020715 RepID=A0A5R9IZS9_9GAMM|nr:nuclear transport factor 2 family protein [Thalassotalea litorea]
MDGKKLEATGKAPESLKPRHSHPLWLASFIDVYQGLGTDNLSKLLQVYTPDVHFQDPLHTISGRKQLIEYFQALYTNLNTCQFVIDDVMHNDQEAAIYWRMSFIHPRLNGGNPVEVEGHSRLRAQGDKVVYHRDYLDVGAMLYEHIPVLGRFVKIVKVRAGQ